MNQNYEPSNSKKNIFLHIGLPKTGTSFLQSFLSSNWKELELSNISYPFPEQRSTIEHGVCTGNITHKMQSYATADRQALDMKSLIEHYIVQLLNEGIKSSKADNIIFSSEQICTNLNSKILNLIKSNFNDHNLTLIVFVRDIYDLSMSGWKQVVKADYYAEFFDHLVEQYQNFSFVKLSDLFSSGINFKIINYETHKNDLIDVFFKITGLSFDQSRQVTFPPSKVNRSLSYDQAKLIVETRKRGYNDLLSAKLLNYFISHPDEKKDPYFPEIDRYLLDKLKSKIEEINHYLPIGEKLRVEPRTGSINEQMNYDIVLQTLDACNEAFNQFLDKPKKLKHPDLPKDFDERVYLLRNPDLVRAGVDPVYHYLKHGRFEGRR